MAGSAIAYMFYALLRPERF
ncbi:potassium-transporting ATPase subunit F [Brevibacterium otitidis]|uniref:Potassium-transporting ATPase subunit F n=1 Tax=Brevibacterium otitidis TaxID=53364 RepID=A0ABV5WYR5_9MICO